MCWGTEPSTPPAKRSATKRLCQRLSGTYRPIGIPSRARAKTESKPARKRCRNPARLRAGPFGPPGGFSAGCWCSLRGGAMRTVPQGTPGGRRACENAFPLSDVCRAQKPLKTPYNGIVSGAAHSAGMAGTARAYPRRARTGADGVRGRRAYIRTGARLCGALGGSWGDLGRLTRSGIKKAPDGSGAGDYLKRRAALKRVASGSRSRNKTGMRSPPMLLYHILAKLSRGQASVKRLETVSRLYWVYSSA